MTPLKPLYSKIAWWLAVIALIGFVDATYLTIEHYRGIAPPCSIVLGCEVVTSSGYATILSIPVALLGALYYLGILCAVLWYLKNGNEKLLKYIKYGTIIGLAASAYFVYLQIGVIGSICQYCMLSAGTSTALFIISWSGIKKINN